MGFPTPGRNRSLHGVAAADRAEHRHSGYLLKECGVETGEPEVTWPRRTSRMRQWTLRGVSQPHRRIGSPTNTCAPNNANLCSHHPIRQASRPTLQLYDGWSKPLPHSSALAPPSACTGHGRLHQRSEALINPYILVPPTPTLELLRYPSVPAPHSCTCENRTHRVQ